MYTEDDEYEDNGSYLEDFIADDNEEIDYEMFDDDEEEFNEEFEEDDYEVSPFYDDVNDENEDDDEDEDENEDIFVSHNPISSINIHDLPSTQPWNIFHPIPVRASMSDR
jgi:hypothetical protein